MMATLRASSLIFLVKRSKPFIGPCQRYLNTTTVVSNWNKDWKPGPIPRTPEERAAAAKKYGLRPEDYNALADREIGDYPDLPIVSKQWRDPYEDYDFPGYKRNYGEPIHPDSDLVGTDLSDPKQYEKYTVGQTVLYSVLTFFGFLGVFLLVSPYPYFPPQMPKQYPFNDLYLEKGGNPELEKEVKHYTFEPASSG